jgi:hypothetical protein
MTKIDKTFDEQDQALKYSEDEPRDEAGRWSASGASDNPTATAARFAKSEGTAKMHSDDHHVTWFSRAGGHFAQGYTANEKERAGVASPNESKVAERFRQDYKVSEARHGFAGSGSGVYTHVATGRQFSAEAMPNGKGFWGTDHVVTELPKGYTPRK